ncbi:MAG: hypothetical protein HOE48_22055 [Candidatus Latescibacteria bacterium]|jgi:hypothetical protein|nr:hypothetical protein [Candidatus Latescibacterota bacterium]MBT4140611.1 hypothetical protein [Candidatus Latescibacterota bacterium]MBT5832873.1 hypothetical protein [Candidatus Latescibacterota bacterium]
MALDASDLNVLREAIRESMDAAQEKIQQTVFSQLEDSQEKMAQMIARQFVELKTEVQDVQVTARKVGTRQAQVEADLAEVGRNSELIKRRLSDLHDDLGTGDRVIQEREMALRIDHLEREVGELRNRLSAV